MKIEIFWRRRNGMGRRLAFRRTNVRRRKFMTWRQPTSAGMNNYLLKCQWHFEYGHWALSFTKQYPLTATQVSEWTSHSHLMNSWKV